MFVICSAVTFKVLPTRRLTKMVVIVVGIFVLKFLLLNSSPAFYRTILLADSRSLSKVAKGWLVYVRPVCEKTGKIKTSQPTRMLATRKVPAVHVAHAINLTERN